MPLVAIALVAYVAGLLAGFSGSIAVSALAVVAAGLVGLQRGRPAALGLVALSLAGSLIARAYRRDDARCMEAASRAREIRLVVEDSVGPGGFARARLA
jgi:hypothetical protein